MSHLSRTSRALAIAGVSALAITGAAVTSAQAAVNFDLKATCKYPLVGIQPLSLAILAQIPAEVVVDEPTDRFQITATATAGGNTSEAIRNLNAYSVSGESNAYSSLKFPSGFVQNVLVPITVDKWSRVGTAIPSPLVLTAKGSTPELTFDELGKVDVFVDGIDLNLAAFDKAGAPINVKKITTDINGQPFADSDGDPFTFDVSCKLDADQDLKLTTIQVNPPMEIPNLPPSQPGTITSTPAANSAQLKWDASVDTDGTVVGYDVTVDGKTTRTAGTVLDVTGLDRGKTYAVSIVAIDDDGLKSAPRTGEFSTLTPIELDLTAPTAPSQVPVQAGDVGQTAVEVRWGASTDNVGVVGYKIYHEDDVYEAGSDARVYRVTGLGAGSDRTFRVTAVDAAGNESAALEQTLTYQPTTLPAPGRFTASAVTPTSVTLTWDAPLQAPGGTVSGYNIYRDSTLVQTVKGQTTTVAGLTPETQYAFSIRAIDLSGNLGNEARLAIVTPDDGGTDPEPINYKYSLAGSTQLKTLTKGTLPLAGDVNADLTAATGEFVADLALKPTQGRLTTLGFLPVTAKVAFVTSGKTTGLLDDGVLTTKSLVRIKLPEVKLFGAVPLAGGNNCQTKSLSTINLKSTDNFDPFAGGSIAGTFAISDLNGCGVLNGLVSPLTAGGGNTINLKLTAKPGQ